MTVAQPKFYTTKVEAAKTAQEIGEIVREHGARRYQVKFDGDGKVTGVAFGLIVERIGFEVPVKLTAQTEALSTRLRGHYPSWDAQRADEQALRVAWRQLKAYVEICMEMVENGVKPFHEVFMADVLLRGRVRVAERFEELSGRRPQRTKARVIELPTRGLNP